MSCQPSCQITAGPSWVLIIVAAVTLFGGSKGHAADHRDAPLIALDPGANLTDLFAFVGRKYNSPSETVLNVIAHLQPVSDRFADDALYSIHITDSVSGETALRYDFQFSDTNPLTEPGLKEPNTILSYGRGSTLGSILSNDSSSRNYTQTYTVSRNGTAIGGDLLTPPPNVGLRTTPLYNDPLSGLAISGATQYSELDRYTQQAIHDLPTGEAVFAGQREDGFYADYTGIFDLLDPRIVDNNGDFSDGLGQDGGGPDSLRGHNVMAFALQIPLAELNSITGFPVVGVHASVSRPRIRVLRSDGEPFHAGPFVQVERMGNPLFSDLFLPLAAKDLYNRTSPTEDAELFAAYAEEPEMAFLINTILFGGSVIPESGRTDLEALFIPDVLRVDTSTGPVRLPGQAGFSRLSEFGGDTTAGLAGGYPNGRRPGDDVVDIVLTKLAQGTLIGDNVSANDQLFHQVFPYSATPHAAATNTLIGALQSMLGSDRSIGLNEIGPPAEVPEPSGLMLATMALLGIVAMARSGRSRARRTSEGGPTLAPIAARLNSWRPGN